MDKHASKGRVVCPRAKLAASNKAQSTSRSDRSRKRSAEKIEQPGLVSRDTAQRRGRENHEAD